MVLGVSLDTAACGKGPMAAIGYPVHDSVDVGALVHGGCRMVLSPTCEFSEVHQLFLPVIDSCFP